MGIVAEKRLVLGKTNGVLNESCEVFTGSVGERAATGQRGREKGWLESAPVGSIQKNPPLSA